MKYGLTVNVLENRGGRHDVNPTVEIIVIMSEFMIFFFTMVLSSVAALSLQNCTLPL